MILDLADLRPDPAREAMGRAHRMDETACLQGLLPAAEFTAAAGARIAAVAGDLVAAVRAGRQRQGGLDSFLHEYDLSSREGVGLMCLAEALLRIPDAETANLLIRDKLAPAHWERHLGHSPSLFVNASTWGLLLTGRFVQLEEADRDDAVGFLGRLMTKSGEPVIRAAIVQAMRLLSSHFVMGRGIEEALARAAEDWTWRYSFDMLGEAAMTEADAGRYFQSYLDAVEAIGKAVDPDRPDHYELSVKLSALHPRFEFSQRRRLMGELVPRLRELAERCRRHGLGLTVDAEEADRLEPSLDVFAAVFEDSRLAGWEGLGIAVQAYQKRAGPLLDWLAELARKHRRRLNLRLVKGAYWDTEIKRSQVGGFEGYPVFTRKTSTDVAYLACARRLLAARDAFQPRFASHNAHTVAAVIEMAGKDRDFEFQRLHGMGEDLYARVSGEGGMGLPCRVYAPVGGHEALLPYLIRRLLENGANSSFVNRIVDERLPVEEIVADPAARAAAYGCSPHPRIPLPANLFGAERRNSGGLDLADPWALEPLARELETAAGETWVAGPIVGGAPVERAVRPLFDPSDRRRRVGEVGEATGEDIERALGLSVRAAPAWDATPAEARSDCLEAAAERLQEERARFLYLLVREGGRTLPDAVSEVREAVDYLRYYAARARADFARPRELPGPTGESNRLFLHGRGVFACISPWNFPLAIFIGQVSAALAAGNAVVAKPASQTPLVAAQAVRLLLNCGIPADVLHLLPGGGGAVGQALVDDPRVAGVVMTGATETARAIHRSLAARQGPIVPLIAETGGQNVMIVDSTALTEQVVRDAILSAFDSAGQRCSALRVLFIQEEVADATLEMLAGAAAERTIGDPARLSSDIGPVIDEAARASLETHVARMETEGRLLFRATLPESTAAGCFFAPHIFEIDSIARLEAEVFGPILHVIRYRADTLDSVIDSINATGYGLTLGIHSRIEKTVAALHARLRAGNAYVNRNMIGAVVGVQPFGGEGLSGTGPKAGGPHYLHRFATERTLSVDTTAAGGNATLLALREEDGASEREEI
jgi:RHH-type proline utilization regulon transcriptional repressor/proline dehydrogenase/delta 1-pyrroline-5-carboxylate dehydrogenase